MPQGPGLGITINEETVERYTIPRECRVPDGNYADMVFGRSYDNSAGPYETG